MKNLKKLNILIVATVMLLGMSSCLKSSDPNFGIIVNYAYILQEGAGDDAHFTPIVQIQGNKPISDMIGSAPVCKFENQKFSFTPVKGYENYVFQASHLFNIPVDTVAKWNCEVTATSKTESPEAASQIFTFKQQKALGEFKTDNNLEYDGKSDKVTGSWSAVENAVEYVLVYIKEPSMIWLPLKKFNTTTEGDKIKGEVMLSGFNKDENVKIAVAAHNGTFWSIKAATNIKIGTSTNSLK